MIQLEDLYLMPYELTVGVRNKQTGRSTPITCDFCSTWQQGAKAGRITFKRPSDKHSFTFLCCGDLKCSLHVRNLTPESILSRTNLREDITTENRIERLKHNLKKVVIMLQVKPIN